MFVLDLYIFMREKFLLGMLLLIFTCSCYYKNRWEHVGAYDAYLLYYSIYYLWFSKNIYLKNIYFWKKWKSSIDTRRCRNPVRRSNSSLEMSTNWKNPFLSKEKLNVQQQIDKDFTCLLEIKLDAELIIEKLFLII